MKEEVFCTIGIPVYNAEKFLKQALDSVLRQTHENFEVLITDDGSTDKSLEIIKSYDDSRIIVLSDGQNKGISYRLNQQIDIAKGKYFVRMDADDIMFPDRLEKQIKFLENNKNTDAIGSSIVIINDDNEIIAFREAKLIDNYQGLFREILFNHPTVAGKIEFFRKFRYSERFVGVEDLDLWTRSFPESNFQIIEEPLLFYRDPYKFKLKTYVFRINQKIKLIKENKELSNQSFLKQRLLIFENRIKIILASILTLLKKDHLLISRRNSGGNESIKKEWIKILNKNNG